MLCRDLMPEAYQWLTRMTTLTALVVKIEYKSIVIAKLFKKPINSNVNINAKKLVE